MTKTNIVLSADFTSAYVSKSFMKKAHVYGTKEYNELRQFKLENPEIEVKVRTITKNSDKESYKNLTYDNMKVYISELENKDALLAEFDRQKRMAVIAKNPYRYVLNWFKSACFESDMEFASFRATLNSKEFETSAIA